MSVLQCYPAYVKTNISKNALVGEGVSYGKTDANINDGIPVDVAVDSLLRAMYLKRSQIVLGSPFFFWVPKLLYLSETLTDLFGVSNFKS